MKSSTYIILFLFSIFISCQNKEPKNSSTIPAKDLKDYLEIQIENNSLLIGKLNSTNENVKDDYTILKEKDTLFVIKNFLESDDFDGKKIILKDKNVKEIKLKYNISYHFNGTEKENIFLNLSYLYFTNLDSKNLIPSFKDIKNRKEIISYLDQNKSAIKKTAYNNYLNYYQNIPENELKNCCITDYQNYNRIKNLSESELETLNLENDLGVFLDYKSLIIEITTNSNKKTIVAFTKDKREPKIKQQKKDKNSSENLDTVKPSTWKGSYEITAKAISDYDNKEIDLYYAINIGSDKSAVLSIGADQSADFWCEGNYKLNIKDNIITAKGKCDQDDINDFFIKYDGENYFIKSKRFENKDWQKLLKK